MLKVIGGFIASLVFVGVLAYNYMNSLMFWEIPSPFGVEDTAARAGREAEGLPRRDALAEVLCDMLLQAAGDRGPEQRTGAG